MHPEETGLLQTYDLTRREAIHRAHEHADRLLRTIYVVVRHGDFLVLLPEALLAGDLIVHVA